MEQACYSFFSAARLAHDPYRNIHPRKRFHVEPKLPHDRTGGNEEQILANFFNFFDHGTCRAAYRTSAHCPYELQLFIPAGWLQGGALHNFEVVPLNAYGQRSLNCINGKDEAVFAVAVLEDSFHPVEGAAAYADALPGL